MKKLIPILLAVFALEMCIRDRPWLEEELHRITEDFSPDVIHCFGTEYPHTLAVCRVFPHKEKDRKSTRLNSSHSDRSRMPSSA